jgi:predicted molibdopterin-dependent oxidoreductase YjgC
LVFGEDVTKHGIPATTLAKLDTLIVSDILPNETTKLAHLLLPGTAHAEKRGSFTNANGRVQRFFPAVQPPGDARAEWEFLAELVSIVTGQAVPQNIEGLFNLMAREVPAFAGLTWAGLGEHGAPATI